MANNLDLFPYYSGLAVVKMRSTAIGAYESRLRYEWANRFNIPNQVLSLFYKQNIVFSGCYIGGSVMLRLCDINSDIDFICYSNTVWADEYTREVNNIARKTIIPALVHDHKYNLHLLVQSLSSCVDPSIEENMLIERVILYEDYLLYKAIDCADGIDET